MGRPPGSVSVESRKLKEMFQKHAPDAVQKVLQLAGLAWVEEKDPFTGLVVMVDGFSPDGSPMLDEKGNRVQVPKMKRHPPATSEQAQIAALNIIFERGFGKATQPLSGDRDGPPIQITGVQIEEVLAGLPTVIDGTYREISEEDAEANFIEQLEKERSEKVEA